MKLEVNIRHLEHRTIELRGEVSADELDLDLRDEVIQVNRPLRYDLRAERLGAGLLLQGRLELPLHCNCIRCLRTFDRLVVLDGWACHVPLEGDDAVAVGNDVVDLTPYVREDILLALPQHPLCESGCRGLSSAPRGEVPPSDRGRQTGEVSVWAELDKLKL